MSLRLDELRHALPRHLQERLRSVGRSDVSGTGPIVYWMRSCLRGHENPALDVAIHASAALKVGLLVFLHVEDQYPHATARRQLFLLQGARSAQEELLQRGLSHVVVHVDRNSSRGVHRMLMPKAQLVVAEEPFCVPWLRGIEELRSMGGPLWLVDCASVVPCALVPQAACHRAYAFEHATEAVHQQLAPRPWQEVQPEVEANAPLDWALPRTLDLKSQHLEALMKDMDVDHSVAPVTHTCGGSSEGYARWQAWVNAGGLKTYAKRRNESLDVHGVSRMSAFLNTGMVSPMRIARLAFAASGAGKGKFLNEFLIWRGLSYAHFYHFSMPATGATLAQLPSWAQQTLLQHAGDQRKVIPVEQLRAARSGNAAWDGMQQYLVDTGELHNNARMGWGKAVLKWTDSPQGAMDVLIELNNVFALDGHAPPSYGGLLGCLGLFEGPKQESAVVGKVSYKPPKSKYSAMPEVARELLKCDVQVGGIARYFEPPTADHTVGEAAPKRRWTRKLVSEVEAPLIEID